MPFDPTTRHQPCRDADEAIVTRQSIRAFLPTPVPRELVEVLRALVILFAIGYFLRNGG